MQIGLNIRTRTGVNFRKRLERAIGFGVIVGEHLAQLVTIIIRVYYNMNICIINQIRLNSKPNERPDLIF